MFLRCYPHLIEQLPELENKVLGCWCENSKLCHGSILIKLYHEKYEEEKDGEFEKEMKRKKIDDLLKRGKKHYAIIKKYKLF